MVRRHRVTLAYRLAFASTTVTLFFEGADNGPGIHEQRYYADIGIY